MGRSNLRSLAGPVVLALLAGTLALSPEVSLAATETAVVAATDDATVAQGSPSATAGSATTLEVDNSPVSHALVRFDLAAFRGRAITSARLRLRCTNSSNAGGVIRLSGTAWSEASVTWNTAPAAGATAATLGGVSSGQTYEVDLTAAVVAAAADPAAAIGLRITSGSTDGADYASGEHTSLPGPQLVVVAGPPEPADPVLSVGDVSVTEGDAGTTDAAFVVSLDPPSAGEVTVGYATADGSAVAGADYTAVSGTLVFPPGTTSLTVVVPVVGDLLEEPDRTFLLTLSGATGAPVADGQATGTIVDDDGPPPPAGITLVGHSTGSTPNSFLLTVPAPSGYQAGDVLLAIVTGGSPVGTAPPGWTFVEQQVKPVEDLAVSAFWKVAAVDEPAGWTWQLTGEAKTPTEGLGAATILALRGVDPAAPVADHAIHAQTSGRTSSECPSVTSPAGGFLVCGFSLDDVGSVRAPSGMTLLTNFRINDDDTHAVAYAPVPEAGPTGTRTASTGVSSGGGDDFGIAVALAPAR
ncbi:MAG: DUF7594 domain-containing protein [Actinomycetota bacterium]